MGDEVIGSVTGLATFKHVSVYKEDEKVRVLGEYVDDTTTLYEAPPEGLRVNGLKMTVGDTEATTFTPTDDDGWVWVEATEDELRITSEKPDQ